MRVAVVGALLITVVAAGCGSGGSGPGLPTPTRSLEPTVSVPTVSLPSRPGRPTPTHAPTRPPASTVAPPTASQPSDSNHIDPPARLDCRATDHAEDIGIKASNFDPR